MRNGLIGRGRAPLSNRTKWNFTPPPFSNPASLAGLAVWYDASNAASLTMNGGSVAQINDLSGNNNHAAMAVAGKQPVLNVAAMNGLSTLGFTSAAATQLLMTRGLDLNAGFTAAAVARHVDGSILEILGDTVDVQAWPFEWYSDNQIYTVGLGAGVDGITSAAKPSTTYTALVMRNIPQQLGKILADGANLQVLAGSTTKTLPSVKSIGVGDNSLASNGAIGELVVYDHSIYVPTDADLAAISYYLAAKWGINFPTTIPGLQLWFDASDASTITQVAGAVSQWKDKSGNGRNLTQPTGSAQPIIQTAAQNGLNTLRFTATSLQRMLLAAPLNLDAAFTAIGVVKRAGPAGTNRIEGFGSTINANSALFEWYGDAFFYSTNSAGYFNSPAEASVAHNVFAAVRSGTSGKIYMNGADVTVAGPVNTGFQAQALVDTVGYGDSRYTNGDIAELILYNTVLTPTEIARVSAYLKAKWGTP